MTAPYCPGTPGRQLYARLWWSCCLLPVVPGRGGGQGRGGLAEAAGDGEAERGQNIGEADPQRHAALAWLDRVGRGGSPRQPLVSLVFGQAERPAGLGKVEHHGSGEQFAQGRRGRQRLRHHISGGQAASAGPGSGSAGTEAPAGMPHAISCRRAIFSGEKGGAAAAISSARLYAARGSTGAIVEIVRRRCG